jgi:phosphate transport system permease protein
VAEDSGKLSQWFLIRDKGGNSHLTKVKTFEQDIRVKRIVPELRRKGMLVLDDQGTAVVLHATSERELVRFQIPDGTFQNAVLSPRADKFVLENGTGEIATFDIVNPHPEISWKVLWEQVWYEGYEKPEYLWQSTSATNEFEPKFSLIPLTFGTIKAAFYAMLFAVPLSIMGAIYTAYFMEPKMRNWVKPSIEIMEALPTVILGFLAGLWLAPIVEQNLLAIISLFLVMPLGILLFGWAWIKAPRSWVCCWNDGWYAALLVPVMMLLGWVALEIAPFFEHWFFGGNVQTWFRNEFGIGYDQRNAVVVGIAMGVAVVPTIFSITEDAIFSVPRYLTMGSLALGATPWQTLIRVVLLTASPGIFSAIMIGLGRAVGETMIVLMATGNTPVMDLSIFQGMRTLSANVAVELPESEVGSSHYRILFLAALVLFAVTFLFNTTAEIVRQRLRQRYSNL